MTTTPTVGNEVQFSPFTEDFAPEIVALGDDTFDIVWSRDNGPDAGGDIVGRHLNEFGSFTGGDFLQPLSDSTTQEISGPRVIRESDGTVAVNFTQEFAPGDHDIRTHHPSESNPNASFQGVEFSSQDEILLDSVARPAGPFTGAANAFLFVDPQGVETLRLDLVDKNGGRFLDPNGQPVLPITVGQHAGQVQENPALASLPSDITVIAYGNRDAATGNSDVRLHTYGTFGVDVSGEVIVSAPGGHANFPDVTTLRDGSFVVAWQESDGIAYRHYNGFGQPLDPLPHVISNSFGFVPKITALHDGGFMIGWTQADGRESDGSPDLDIFMQRFDGLGNAVGDRIHLAQPGDQGFFTFDDMNLATLDDGRVLLTYRSETGDATDVTTLDYRIIDPRDGLISGDDGDNTIVGRADGSGVLGLGGDDRLFGGGASDGLNGGAGDDQLVAFGGDDGLVGGAGNDLLDGGAGSDFANYLDATSGVTVSLAVVGPQNTGGAGIDTLVSIEKLDGSVFADHLTGDAGANTLAGEDGNDVLIGGAGDDILEGDGGNDVLRGDAGNDLMVGGDGIDRASYATATSGVTVSLAGTGAQDTHGAGIDALVGIENLTGSNFNDTLTGNGGANLLQGAGGNDVLIGGAGDDVLDGGLGNDVLRGDAGNDVLIGGDGVDTASYVGAAAGVTVSLALIGAQNTHGAGIDTLSTIENLIGSSFNDVLIGNNGNNRLAGGGGNDTLTGAGGHDIFVFTNAGGADTVQDFQNGTDKLSISGFGSALNTASEIISHATQVGADTHITLHNQGVVGNTVITLHHFALTNLDASDLIVTA